MRACILLSLALVCNTSQDADAVIPEITSQLTQVGSNYCPPVHEWWQKAKKDFDGKKPKEPWTLHKTGINSAFESWHAACVNKRVGKQQEEYRKITELSTNYIAKAIAPALVSDVHKRGALQFLQDRLETLVAFVAQATGDRGFVASEVATYTNDDGSWYVVALAGQGFYTSTRKESAAITDELVTAKNPFLLRRTFYPFNDVQNHKMVPLDNLHLRQKLVRDNTVADVQLYFRTLTECCTGPRGHVIKQELDRLVKRDFEADSVKLSASWVPFGEEPRNLYISSQLGGALWDTELGQVIKSAIQNENLAPKARVDTSGFLSDDVVLDLPAWLHSHGVKHES